MRLEINSLTKSYSRGKKALDNFSLTFETGVYGILGPNGAGKSTLINCITGIIKPDSGSIKFDESRDYIRELGFLPQNQRFYPNFTARELILYVMALKKFKCGDPKKYADDILKRVNLYDDRNKKTAHIRVVCGKDWVSRRRSSANRKFLFSTNLLPDLTQKSAYVSET